MIRVRDGSLDHDAMRLLADLAAEKGSSGSGLSASKATAKAFFIIEDGAVARRT